MPEHHNSLSNAVADAMERHAHNEEEAKKISKKLTLIQQIAAQVQQSQKSPFISYGKHRS